MGKRDASERGETTATPFDRRQFLRGGVITGGGLTAARLLGHMPVAGAQTSGSAGSGSTTSAAPFSLLSTPISSFTVATRSMPMGRWCRRSSCLTGQYGGTS
jgi:hypothetical protein